jgi:hypothetical protein
VAVWNGYKKGLIMGIGGIAVLVVSVSIGSTLSTAYSQEVITAMRPFAAGYTEKLLTDGVYETLGVEESEYSIEDLLAQNPRLGEQAARAALAELGLSDDPAEVMAAEAVEDAKTTGMALSDSLTEVVCSRVAFAAAFILFFLLSAIVLTVIGNITNLSFRIPYLGRAMRSAGPSAAWRRHPDLSDRAHGPCALRASCSRTALCRTRRCSPA